MKPPKAVIFDVYRTLLDVSPNHADHEAQWNELHRRFFGEAPSMDLEHLNERCQHIISEDHSHAHEYGVPHPEVVWVDVMRRALPAFEKLPAGQGEDFLFGHIQLLRDLRLAPRAPAVLRECLRQEARLGITSNAQPYTVRELGEALAGAGLDLGMFDEDLCLWSFQNGFSKPDAHVFRLLAFRLINRGISPAETLIIGDRLDNDIEPARAQGFQTWWLNESHEGDWEALIAARFPQLAL